MLNQFSRTELLFGKYAIDKLKKSKVIIFGLGGVGGYVAEALTRSATGKIDIVDFDKITPTNLNRQIIALHSTLGRYKTDVMKERMLDINPEIEIETYNLFYDAKTSIEFDFSKYDYVVDAIDCVSSKIEIITNAKKCNTPVISSMGTGNKINPFLFEIADISKTSVCPLARIMRYELKKRNIKDVKVLYSKEIPKKPKEKNIKTPPSSNAFIPSIAGLIIAGEVVSDIINYSKD